LLGRRRRAAAAAFHGGGRRRSSLWCSATTRDTQRPICCCSEMPYARSLSMCAQRQHPSAQMNHHCCPPTMQFFCMRIRKEARTHLCVVIASQSLLLWRSTKTQMQNFALEALILDVCEKIQILPQKQPRAQSRKESVKMLK